MTDPGLLSFEISRRAERDLRKLQAGERARVRTALESLAADAENLDVKALAGRGGWLRLRVGQLRVLYWPLSPEEAAESGRRWLVARVVPRRELDRAVASLER